MNATCILKSARRLKPHSQSLKWTLCLKILGGGIWLVPTSGTNAHSTTAHISSSCRTLSFFYLLAAEKESRPAPRAIMQQHVKLCSFALCKLQHLLISYWQGLHKAESQYLWPLKHKTTRTIIHQSNPLQMNNKAEFITWSLQTVFLL